MSVNDTFILFQFLIVRLKGRSRTNVAGLFHISIPYSSIKSYRLTQVSDLGMDMK